MTKFVYSNLGGRTTVDADGELWELAGEVGRVAHTIYSAYAHQDPETAEAFKELVIASMTHPKSPVWNVRKNKPGDIEIICETPSEDGEK